MRGVEDVKEVFHLGFAALAVVERQERKGEQRPPLNGVGHNNGVIDRSYQQIEGSRANLPRAAGHQVNENRQQNSPNAVVDVKVGARQHARQNEHKCRHKKERAKGGKTSPDLFGFYNTVNGINNDDGKRKGDKNALVKALHCHKIDDLKNDAHSGNDAKIFGTVFGVATALGNHVGKNREGDSAKNAKDGKIGKEEQPYVVEQHAHHGNDLELIVCQPKFTFFCLIHNSSLGWIL